jgi:hypothetical protein
MPFDQFTNPFQDPTQVEEKYRRHPNLAKLFKTAGMLPAELSGKPCPYAQAGRMPEPVPLSHDDPAYTIDKGQLGDLCPPCAKQQLAHLGHWLRNGARIPKELRPLRLFKCRQWFWLVVPGLYDDEPTKLHPHNHVHRAERRSSTTEEDNHRN